MRTGKKNADVSAVTIILNFVVCMNVMLVLIDTADVNLDGIPGCGNVLCVTNGIAECTLYISLENIQNSVKIVFLNYMKLINKIDWSVFLTINF